MANELNKINSAFGAEHATFASYTAGFLFSILLTLIPYEIARERLLEGADLLYIITGFALLQLFVQSIFFLHLNLRSKAKWNLIVIVFTFIMVTFLVVGTIWIMQNLTNNMMSPLRLNYMMDLTHGN